MPDKPLKVYAIEKNTGSDKNYWHEIGIAWRNRDNSLNVKLYMMPLLSINIREENGNGEPR